MNKRRRFKAKRRRLMWRNMRYGDFEFRRKHWDCDCVDCLPWTY